MTRQETAQILAILKTAYPTYYRGFKDAELVAIVNLWTEMFAEDDVRLVGAAVKAVIASDTNGFPPNIGTIKERMRLLLAPERDTAAEAWNLVRKAISYYHAKRNFEALPELCKLVVGGASQLRDWAVMEISDINTVVQSNFLRAYRAKEKARREYDALPAASKGLIAGVAQRLLAEAHIEGSAE